MLNPNYTLDEIRAYVASFTARLRNEDPSAIYELWQFLQAIGEPPTDSSSLLGQPDRDQRMGAVGIHPDTAPAE